MKNQNLYIMNNRILAVLALSVLVWWGCGSTTEVVAPQKVERVVKAAGSATSTGLCKALKTDAETKQYNQDYSLYREFYKQKNYAEAMPYWTKIMALAPGERKTPFIDGAEMYKSYIDEGKTEYLTKLMNLYDERIKCHGEKGKVLWDQAMAIKKYEPNNEDKQLKLVQQSFDIDGSDASSTVMKYLYAKRVGQFKSGAKTESEVMALRDKIKMAAQKAITTRGDADGKFAEIVEMTSKPLTSTVTTTTKTVSSGTSAINSCEEAAAYYDEKYRANPNDIKVLKGYYSKLGKFKCYNSGKEALYKELITKINSIEPSKASLLKGAVYKQKAKDYNGAAVLYEKALNMESDPMEKAKIYNYAAGAYRGAKNNTKSASMAEQALALNPNYGKAYMTLGNLYLGSFGKCGSSDVEKAGVAWLAADMYAKAKNDPETAAKAQELLNKAYQYFPDKSKLFMMTVAEGSSHRVGCWINKSTTVRAK